MDNALTIYVVVLPEDNEYFNTLISFNFSHLVKHI